MSDRPASPWRNALGDITPDALTLLADIAGSLHVQDDAPRYRLLDVDPANGTQFFEHSGTKHVFRIAVEQLTGVQL